MKTLFTFALAFLISNVALAGTFTNGSDFTSDNENVWFLGLEPIEYCIERSPQFRIPHDRAREIVREAFADWRAFFIKYGLDQLKFEGIAKGRSLGIAIDAKEVAACTKPATQVRFLFGVDSLESLDARRSHPSALALSIRGAYDHTTFRNGGQLWFRNWLDWNETKLKHIVLHEIGHVFGMPHDSVYVMEKQAADFAALLASTDRTLGQIESPTWPYRLRAGDTVDFTTDGRKDKRFEPNFLLVFIQNLLGFERDGWHSVQLRARDADTAVPMWKLDVTFRERGTGKELTLGGQFFIRGEPIRSPKGLRGPELYTRYDCRNCASGTHMDLHYLDPLPSGLEAEGSFTHPVTKVVYPAILDDRKGAFLRIFVTERKQWWTVDNYNAVLGGRERTP